MARTAASSWSHSAASRVLVRGGEQLDDDLLDRPHDPQLGIGGQDLIEANTLRDWEAAPLADQLGAVLPRRVDDAPAATSRSQDRRRQTWMTV